MAVAGSEDALPGVRDNFYTNLLLLGFNPTQSEIKHKIVFNKHMFDLPNKKGMEVIMQYLFCKLDEELCRAQFRDCWPVFDKKQEREFRKNCSEWIARISKEASSSDLPGSSAMVMGVLMSPAGERFYQFIRSFSTHVLEENLRKHAPDDFLVPNFSMEYETDPLFREVHVNAMKKMIVRYSSNVNRKLQEISECHNEWRDYVVKLTVRHRDANKLNRALKKKLSDLQVLQRKMASERLPCSHPNTSTSQYDAEVKIEEELSNEKRTAKMKKVKQLWKSLQDFVTHSDHQKKVIESILSGNVDQHMISAKELYFKIPEMLVKDFEELFQQGLVDNTYEEGKLNILSLLNLWNSSLEKLCNTLNQMPIRVPNSTVERKHKELQSIRDELAKQHQKQSALKVRVEENEKEIHKLRTQLDSLTACVTNEQCTIQEQPFIPMPRYTVLPLNMSFLKATPLKQPQELITTSSLVETPKLISIVQSDEVSTVERVKKLNDSIQRHAAASQKEMEMNMEIPSMLTMHTTQQILPVVANKTNIGTIRKRIEYYSDSDNEEDDDHDLDALPMSTPEFQLLSSPATPSTCDKSDVTMKFSSSPSPRDPQDILADKIASYVVANSDESSPDPKLLNFESTSTDEEMSQEESEREENQTVLSMTELECYSSSEEKLSDNELEWPVGVTPDIKSLKARISQRHQLQLSRDEQFLEDSTMTMPDSETSWLHSDNTRLPLVPSTPQLNKTQAK